MKRPIDKKSNFADYFPDEDVQIEGDEHQNNKPFKDIRKPIDDLIREIV